MSAEALKEKITKLDAALAANNPGMELWLDMIHKNLMADPSLPQTLTPEEVGIIVRGLSKKSQIVIVTSTAKATNKKLSGLTEDDI